ncbi:MAG: winged helix-turn-helix transcriptional regulator [Methanofollis sp.]|uniref:winged helix-turn-helix transcriptional regulator n=1 Tax=Methanofollis sp. TaxID=2052835 RepID=UPI00262F9FD2|nr:winged helix-turn-helix transcriptional regulator [Methanofollis sp.]MDD4254744.1 winged helix-turn-helix transcriptional regulator [Methanofollis sp.]
MQKTPTIFFAGILIILLVLSPAAARITVEPGSAEVPPGGIDVDDEEFAPTWQVPPVRLLTTYILIYCPLLAFPADLIYSSGLLAYLGYRIAPPTVPENRKKIHACIRDQPGISASRIAGITGISRGTVAYHISRLQAGGMIKKVQNRGNVGFFIAADDNTTDKEYTLLHMQNSTEREILFLLLDTPELSQSEIADAIGISRPAVSWHMKRLDFDGVVESFRNGRGTYYRLMPDIPDILKKENKDQAISRDSGRASA